MKKKLFYLSVFLVLVIITCLIKPHGDDFLFVQYLDYCGIGNMQYHRWAHDCILLPRGFWRPVMDLFAFYILAPSQAYYTYIMHFFSVLFHIGCAYMVFLICRKMRCSEKNSFIASVFFIFCTTCMGGMIPGDGLAQVSTSFFGLLSVLCYVSDNKYRVIGWLLFGIIAMFWKDGGFVWIPVGPIFNEILVQKNRVGFFHFKNVRWARFIKVIILSLIPAFIFITVYLSFKPDLVSGLVQNEPVVTEISTSNSIISVDQETESHTISFAYLVKSAFILYVASIFPIDTSAVYYHNWVLLGITVVLSIIGLFFIFKSLISYGKNASEEFLGLFLIILWISSVSLLTRAGEISPHPSNTFMAVILGLALDKIEIRKFLKISLVAFAISTLITDAHKYYLCYVAGRETSELAKQVKAKTEGLPHKVLCISVGNHKKNGAFIVNTPNDFYSGVSVLHEYGWNCPLYFDAIKYHDSDDDLAYKIDSVIVANKDSGYDCIWIQRPESIEVLNLK